MIVNYIDIDFVASTIQEDFNEASRIAVLAAKSNPSVISKVRVTMADEDDKVELLHVFHEYDEKSSKDEFKVVYFKERMKSVGISLTINDNDIKSYVYVVSWNQVWDSNEISNSNKVFASKEDAFKFYEDFKKDEMESIKKKGVSDDWVENDENWVDSDENWESKETVNVASWEYYKDYEYPNYHSCIYIDKREVL